jgi:hypothetical protein
VHLALVGLREARHGEPGFVEAAAEIVTEALAEGRVERFPVALAD